MNRNILRLAIPNIISNITVPLLGMVDIYIVGHLEHKEYIGAIAVAVMIFNFMFMAFSFLRMGTSGFTAQAYGAEDKQEQANILLRALLIGLGAGVLMILMQYLISIIAFRIVNITDIQKVFAEEYFYIYIWAAPAYLGLSTMNGWFVGMQNAKTPMFTAIAINVINILLAFTFVYVFGMQIKGVALATTIAQYSGFILSIVIWNVKYGWIKPYLNIQTLKVLKNYIPFFKVNADIFIRSMALISVTTFLLSISAKMGNEDIIAVNAIILQFFYLFSYIMDGFAYAAEALTGKFIGAKAFDKLKRLIKQLFTWGVILALIFTVAFALFNDFIWSFLTDKADVIESSKDYRFWILLMPIAGFAAFLWDGIFIGATASKQMRNSMLIAVSAFFGIYYLFNSNYDNNILWLAFIVYLSVRGIVQAFMARTVLFKK